jgi:protein TonB
MALHALVIGAVGAALSPMKAVEASNELYVAFEFDEPDVNEAANDLDVPPSQTEQVDDAIADKISNAEVMPEAAALAEAPVEAPVAVEDAANEAPLTENEPLKPPEVEAPANVAASPVPQFADNREPTQIPAAWGNVNESSRRPPGEASAPVANPPAPSADYLALVMRHLEQRKVYPLAARKRGMEGDITVTFVITADGKAEKISATGAHRYLIQAAEQSVRQASPFPVPAGAAFNARLVIRYRLDE